MTIKVFCLFHCHIHKHPNDFIRTAKFLIQIVVHECVCVSGRREKNNITNIEFVRRASEIADFTAHFGWMRFQSFWMTAGIVIILEGFSNFCFFLCALCHLPYSLILLCNEISTKIYPIRYITMHCILDLFRVSLAD